MDIQNLIEIDSDSDIENPTQYNDIMDKLTLEYFPDPFNTIGQFIMTAISGASISCLIKLRENKLISFTTDIESYFQYCKKTEDDNYINDLIKKLKLDNNNSKLDLILNKITDISNNIMKDLYNSHSDIFDKHKNIPESDFNIDIFNVDIIKVMIPLIKYSLISNIIS